jgi:hypothetical protein
MNSLVCLKLYEKLKDLEEFDELIEIKSCQMLVSINMNYYPQGLLF